MKKFAYLKWAKTPEEIYFQKEWLKMFPLFLKERYIIKNCLFQSKEVLIMGSPGYEIILPFTVEDANKKSDEIVQNLMNNVMERLESNKVKIICPPKGHIHKITFSIPTSTGRSIMTLFIYLAVLKATSILNKSLKYMEVTLLDGQNIKTNVVLDILYPNINFLNILTNQPEKFKQKSVEIYEDVGLNLQISSHNKKTALENSEIVIDCTDINHSDFYYCKKNALYIYLGNNKEMVKNILLKRSDLIVIDNFIVSINNRCFSTEFCEMLWYTSKSWINIIFSNDYDLILLRKVISEIKREGWSIEDFCQYGNIIKINKTNRIDKIF